MNPTIRIYMQNGHNVSGVEMTLGDFEDRLRAALARPAGMIPVQDSRGFRHLIVAEKVTHASADAS